jgi:hypothetical protein
MLFAVVGLALAGYGLFVGLRLWFVRPGAIRLVRVYLVVLGASQLVQLVFPYLVGLPSQLAQRVLAQQLPLALVTVGGSFFWWQYFSHSRRVRATYSPAQA